MSYKPLAQPIGHAMPRAVGPWGDPLDRARAISLYFRLYWVDAWECNRSSGSVHIYIRVIV